jgi:hypothetical protein
MSATANIGEQVLGEIIRADISFAISAGVIVWTANAPEVLEAILARHCHEMRRRMLRLAAGESYEQTSKT